MQVDRPEEHGPLWLGGKLDGKGGQQDEGGRVLPVLPNQVTYYL